MWLFEEEDMICMRCIIQVKAWVMIFGLGWKKAVGINMCIVFSINKTVTGTIIPAFQNVTNRTFDISAT
jgi:hypothetical protein